MFHHCIKKLNQASQNQHTPLASGVGVMMASKTLPVSDFKAAAYNLCLAPYEMN